jgi:DNA-binding PadR family transcriptional regulator
MLIDGGIDMGEKYSKLCEKSYQKMQGFMEVCLLVLLYKESGHGYGLIEQLHHFGFTEENINISTLYKTLRRMEEDKLVVSSWEQGDQGPQKRVYYITDSGKHELENWVVFLKLRKERISKLINRYEQIVKSTK